MFSVKQTRRQVPGRSFPESQREAIVLRRSAARGLTGSREASGEGISKGSAGERRPVGLESTTVPPIVYEALRSPGQPLDATTRAIFEPRFGHDFSQVRVHTDTKAAESARAVNALGYTVGKNIVFGDHQYAPGGTAGRRLLAHELAHVVQQRIPRDAPPSGIGAVADQLEREADSTAVELTGESQGSHQAFAGVAGPWTLRPGEEPFSQNMFHGATSVVNEAASIPRRLPILTPAKGMVVQRKATFSAGTVHEVRNAAEQIVKGGPAGTTLPALNGKNLRDAASAEAAIKGPEIQSAPKAGGAVKCSLKTVPENVGSFDETVLSAGPWSTQAQKQDVAQRLGLPACKGAGRVTLAANGKPSDADVAKANRTHEDHHATDDEAMFNATIGKWDKKMTDAETAKTVFEGATRTDCETALNQAMGGPPKKVADSYFNGCLGAGTAFHATATGGELTASNATSDAACNKAEIDVRQ